MKKVTSFTHLVTGEGDRIAFTFSEISDTGELVSQNNKGNFIIVDQSVKNAVDLVNQCINQRLEG